jgi:sugar fermentation stimulation protein A
MDRVSLSFPWEVTPATFLSRPNRFLVIARLDDGGTLVKAHCADPGRLRELLLPNSRLYLSPAQAGGRKTEYDLRFVEHPETGQLVSLNTVLPNGLVHLALQERALPQFVGYDRIMREVATPHGASSEINSRIDFCLRSYEEDSYWIEVKSVTLVEGDVALFPDAPTLRGTRHLMELAALVEKGNRAAVLFIVQRPDAKVLRPNGAADAAFARALCHAKDIGVEIYAYRCELTLRTIQLIDQIPVEIIPVK